VEVDVVALSVVLHIAVTLIKQMSSSSAPTASSSPAVTTVADLERKEDFSKYLERSGALESLTRVLVGLYSTPERPANAWEFIKKEFSAKEGQNHELQAALASKEAEIVSLKKEIETLKASLASATVSNLSSS